MSKIGNTALNKLCDFIMVNFTGDCIELDKYLVNIENEIKSHFYNFFNRQDFSDCLCDSNSNDFIKLVNLLRSKIKGKGASSTIRVFDKFNTFYIENTTLGINVNIKKTDIKEFVGILDNVLNLENKVKGEFFERFCSHFLNDMGLSNIYKTPSSADQGVDIIARVPFKIEGPFFEYFLSPEAFILVQCKYLNGKADTPLIRRIIGDSYYYRLHQIQFDNFNFKIAHSPLYLLLISHNGFTKDAIEFAKENSVNILDSNQILNLVCQNKNIDELDCIKYLRNSKPNL